MAFYQPLAVGESLTYTVNYDVIDEHGASVPQSATVTINGTNDTPFATGTIDTQFAQSGVAYSLVLDPGLFDDVDTSDTLTLSATLANGDPLPAWLTFDPVTGTFSGTPNDDLHALLFRVEVTATDPHGASASVEFWLGQGDTFLSGSSAANETVSGTQGDGDILFGGAGTDLLIGQNPTDLFVVTAANDLTVIDDNGFADNDILLLDGIDPSDVLFDRRHPGSSDLVISVAGVPLVLALNTLNSNSSDQIEIVAFGDGSTIGIADIRATLTAQSQTSGADIVTGFEASDTIDGGLGNDFLVGGDSSDEYLFGIGDGQDVVEDNGFADTDVVRFTDRASTDATFTRVPDENGSVLISFANGDSVLLRNGIDGNINDGIEQVIFDGDGLTLTADQIRDILIAQDETSGDDHIIGFERGETIEAGQGNDYVNAGDGSDTYLFNMGDGQDIIDDNGFADTDSVVFTDYALADATFERAGSDLNSFIISFANGDQVVVRDSFNGQTSGSVEQIIFQGTGSDEVLTIADVRALIFAGEATSGNDNLDASNNGLNDTLEAGAGDDYMSGNDGADTYIFGLGDGRDVIFDNGFGDADVLDLSDFASTDVTVRFVEGRTTDIVLTFTTGEEITIINQTQTSGEIASFVFSDTTLTAAQIEALALAGSPPGDVFTGDNLANTLSGNGGYDHLFGNNGGDTYVFDAGDERVEIEDNGNGLGDSLEINGYNSTDATFVRVEGRPLDLRIVFAGGDEITIRNGLANSFADTIETITFNGDAVTYDMNDVRQIMVDNQSSAGDDAIYGYSLSDTLAGGTGDDFLSGSSGGDTYVFNAGDGNDTIEDNGGSGTDRVEINGYDLSDATITQVPGTAADILIDFGNGDSLLLGDALTGSFADGIEEVVFTGPGGTQTVTPQDIRNLLTAAQASAGDDIITGTSASETLEGGLGDDFLTGGSQGDTYVYTLGDGNDTIEDNGGGAGDVLELNGITSGSVSVVRALDNPNSVILTMADGGTIRLENTLDSNFADTIDTITFVGEGVSWTMQDLRDMVIANEATAGNDDISGWSTDDTLFGGTGDDFLTGGGGTDTFIFNIGDGDDIVYDQGGGGTDEIVFNGRDISDASFSYLYDGSNDLLIEFANGDSVVVRETIPGGFSNRIEEYVFDDGTLTHADMLLLL